MTKKAIILATITIIIWASAFAGIRVSLHGGYTPGHLVLTRFLVASLAFILYALWPGVHFRFPEKKDILKIAVLGWVGISIYHIGLTFGEQTVSAGTAGLIIGSAPVFTALIAFFTLKEKLGAFGWIGLLIGFIGILLITLGTSGSTLGISKGALLVLLSAIATSFFTVFQKPLLNRYHPIELTAYFTWAGTLPMLIFLPGLMDGIRHATLEANLTAIYVGLFPAAFAYAIWAIALSSSKASVIASMLYLEPVIAIVIAWIWISEFPSMLSIIGGAIAIASVVIVNGLGNRHSRMKQKTA